MLATGWGGHGRIGSIIEGPAAELAFFSSPREVSCERLLEPRPVESRGVANFDADDALELPDDVRATALSGLTASYRSTARLPATLDELIAVAAVPDPWARALRALVAAGQPEDMVVAVFIALLARGAAPAVLDADVRSACEGAVFRERRYRELRRRVEAGLGATRLTQFVPRDQCPGK
jgi:hypothetical protein